MTGPIRYTYARARLWKKSGHKLKIIWKNAIKKNSNSYYVVESSPWEAHQVLVILSPITLSSWQLRWEIVVCGRTHTNYKRTRETGICSTHTAMNDRAPRFDETVTIFESDGSCDSIQWLCRLCIVDTGHASVVNRLRHCFYKQLTF